MIRGIIYKYTSPSGKHYIGQTTNENQRRKAFNNLNLQYAGLKIDNARRKYSPSNFTYEILEERYYDNFNNCKEDLDRLESYYIGLVTIYTYLYSYIFTIPSLTPFYHCCMFLSIIWNYILNIIYCFITRWSIDVNL